MLMSLALLVRQAANGGGGAPPGGGGRPGGPPGGGGGGGGHPGSSHGGGGGHGFDPNDPAMQAMMAARKAAIAKRTLAANIMWWVLTGIIFCMSVNYIFTLLKARWIRKRAAKARAAGVVDPAATQAANKAAKGSALTAAHALYANYAYVRVFPLWIYSHTTSAEWIWTLAYIGVVLGLTFWGAWSRGRFDYSMMTGRACYAQLPFIIGLASKNNVLSAITGISYEKFNYLHRAAGRVCVLTAWIHWAAMVKRGLGPLGPGSLVFSSGVVAIVGLSLMYITSFGVVRRWFYEAFLITHISMCIMFLVGLYFHRPNLKFWIWPCLFLWGLDRFVSLARMFIINKAWLLPFGSKREQTSSCTVELVDPDVIRLRVKRPLFKWRAGQHAFVTMPGVATLRYEQHPFTMANVPDSSGDAVFLIRAQEGFTRRLVNRLHSEKQDNINCYIDGPYGTPHDYNHYAGVILIAGGTGVTHALGQFLSIIRRRCEPLGSGNCRATVDIYVTRSHAADEPHTDGQRDGEHDLADTVEPTPIGTPKYSPSASQEFVGEKNSDTSSNRSMDKRAAYAGFTAATAAVSQFHRGRSHVESILRTEVEAVPHDAAGVMLTVCGPTELTLNARKAVTRVNTAAAILKGQNPVDFHSETFGW